MNCLLLWAVLVAVSCSVVTIASAQDTFGRDPDPQEMVVNLGVMVEDNGEVYLRTSMDAIASAVNLAVQDFQAQGSLTEYDFRLVMTMGCNILIFYSVQCVI